MTDSGKCVSPVQPIQVARAVGPGESTVKRSIDQGQALTERHRRIPIAAALGFVRGAGLSLLDPAALGLWVGGRATLQDLRSILAANLPEPMISLLERACASGMPAEELAEDWIAPAMASVGQPWESGDLPVTTQHAATSIVMRALRAPECCGVPTQRRSRAA